MPAIEIADEQYAFLTSLGSVLAEEHVGEYGHVRPQDALQYLIDQYETTGEAVEVNPTENVSTQDGGSAIPASGPGRLEAMMNLLEEHADKWEQTDSEGGKYVVTLPDDSTEAVRTKDDIRALLFKHYQ